MGYQRNDFSPLTAGATLSTSNSLSTGTMCAPNVSGGGTLTYSTDWSYTGFPAGNSVKCLTGTGAGTAYLYLTFFGSTGSATCQSVIRVDAVPTAAEVRLMSIANATVTMGRLCITPTGQWALYGSAANTTSWTSQTTFVPTRPYLVSMSVRKNPAGQTTGIIACHVLDLVTGQTVLAVRETADVTDQNPVSWSVGKVSSTAILNAPVYVDYITGETYDALMDEWPWPPNHLDAPSTVADFTPNYPPGAQVTTKADLASGCGTPLDELNLAPGANLSFNRVADTTWYATCAYFNPGTSDQNAHAAWSTTLTNTGASGFATGLHVPDLPVLPVPIIRLHNKRGILDVVLMPSGALQIRDRVKVLATTGRLQAKTLATMKWVEIHTTPAATIITLTDVTRTNTIQTITAAPMTGPGTTTITRAEFGIISGRSKLSTIGFINPLVHAYPTLAVKTYVTQGPPDPWPGRPAVIDQGQKTTHYGGASDPTGTITSLGWTSTGTGTLALSEANKTATYTAPVGAATASTASLILSATDSANLTATASVTDTIIAPTLFIATNTLTLVPIVVYQGKELQ